MKDTIVYWAISTFDRTKEKPLPVETRFWVLDWDKVSGEERGEILRILGARDSRAEKTTASHQVGDEEFTFTFNQPDFRMMKFRDRFTYVPEPDFAGAMSPDGPVTRMLSVNLGVEYFEDEDGGPISKVEMFRHVTGQEDPIILGEPESVLRLGPAPLSTHAPTEDDSNKIACFLDIVHHVAGSSWYRKLPSLTVSKSESARLTQALFPDAAETHAVVVAIRQIYASDQLLNIACNRYMKICGDSRKAHWIKQTKKSFNDFVDGPVAFPSVPDTSTRELIDTFLYGAGIIHSKDTQQAQEKLRALLDAHGKPHVVMAVHASLRHIVGFAIHAFLVLRQDFRAWLHTGSVPQPTRVAMHDLLSSRMREKTDGQQSHPEATSETAPSAAPEASDA